MEKQGEEEEQDTAGKGGGYQRGFKKKFQKKRLGGGFILQNRQDEFFIGLRPRGAHKGLLLATRRPPKKGCCMHSIPCIERRHRADTHAAL